ncbi:MAG: hypothetical protein ABSG62_02120 [Terracidiphilus sp.]
MRMRVWAAAFLFGLGVGAATAQTPAESQPQPAQAGQMNGMATGPSKSMDMSKCTCGCTDMGMAKGMDMGQGKGMDMGKPSFPAGPLKITFGDKSAEWTQATLAALPHKTLTVCNQHINAYQNYSGVPLIDLLKPLGVPDKPHGKDLRLYLVAEGSDGYKAVYAVAEVNPDVHDATVMVADTLDGKPIAASGPLQLVATGERRPARWVRDLVAIRVLTAE